MALKNFSKTWKILKKDKVTIIGALFMAILVMVSFVGPLFIPYSKAFTPDLSKVLKPPGVGLLGTDELGRDLLARIAWGGRVSLLIGLGSVLIGTIAGVIIGLLAGYYPQSKLSTLAIRSMDILLAFPRILLAIFLITILGPGVISLSIAIGISTIPSFARMTRASTLIIRNALYVESAQAAGLQNSMILWRHILPNITSPIIVQFTLSVGQAILMGSGLSFLGLGPQPPMAEWGLMIAQARVNLFNAPRLMIVPGVCLIIITLGLNMLGDSLRDAIDPTLRGEIT